MNIEYTYTLLFKPTNQKYHGCRYSKNCHPSELWVTYFTSSDQIKELIKKHGKDSFMILEIIEYPNSGAYNAETMFLQEHNCANSNEWLNLSNNSKNYPHDSDKFKERMMLKYGVEHVSQLPTTREKTKQTNLDKYGVDNPFKDIKKVKEAMLSKYGVEHNSYREETKLQRKNTLTENYGCEYMSQSPVLKAKAKATMMERYGVDNYGKLEENTRVRTEALVQWWKTAPLIHCPYCGKSSRNKSAMVRWHFNNCKNKQEQTDASNIKK